MIKLQYIQELFNDKVGLPDITLRVPGRANIIGEHIDYCSGKVLPFAIEQSMYFVAKRRDDGLVNVHALDVSEQTKIVLGEQIELSGWANYFYQVIRVIEQKHKIAGLDIYFNSDIPIGAGVSSSSAICVGVITIFNSVFNLGISNEEIIDIALQAEHGMGIRGGIMDQYTMIHSKENQALLLDCEIGSHSYIDMTDNPYKWILLNTNIKHNLSNTPYNKRRSQAEEALRLINEIEESNHTFKTINDSDLDLLNDWPLLRNRVRHVHFEMKRVDKAVEYIQSKEYHKLGNILNQSHHSLSNYYDVSCPELNYICDQLGEDNQVIGARMMGGGFGGSVIALVLDTFDSQKIESEYALKFKIKLGVIGVTPSRGVKVIL